MNIAQLKFFVQKGTVTDEMLKDYIEKKMFTAEELIAEGIITKQDLTRIYKISRAEHLQHIRQNKYSLEEIKELVQAGDLMPEDYTQFLKNNIRNRVYTDDQIKQFIASGELDPNNLLAEGVLSQSEMDDIYDRPLPTIPIGFESWDNIPDLVPDRVDVFVLGVPGSGKSVFMAGLLYYARSNGWLRQDSNHIAGMEYTLALTTAVSNGILPPATPVENIQYMACDFQNERGKWNPMTFIEMSGEIFRKCFGKPIHEMPQKFIQYLQHENSKLLVMAIDYQADNAAYSNSHVAQADYFEYMLPMLRQMGTFHNTRAIVILITKWDLSPDQSDEAARAFLDRRYKNLASNCEQIEEEFRSSGLEFAIFKFSLGSFQRRNAYVYNPSYSQDFYEWLSEIMPETVDKPPKGNWLNSWFGKK
jgi:hypothetical protein